MRILLIVILVSGLQGCAWAVQGISSLEDVNIVEPEPLDEAKPSRFENSSEQSVYLRQIYLQRRNLAVAAAFGSGTADTDASVSSDRYFQAGITLSNDLCSEWFGRLERSNVAMAETRDTLANAGTATTTIMGATSASTEALTIVASIFGFGRQAATDLSTNYVITPDLAQVEQMMSDYRTNYVKSVFTSDDRTDFQRATRALILYHSLCTAPVVRSLVNRSISEANLQPSNESKAFEDTILAAAARDVTKHFANVTLSVTDFQYLYAFEFQDAVGAKPVLDKISEYLKARNLLDTAADAVAAKDEKIFNDEMNQLKSTAGAVIEPSVKRLVNSLVPPPPAASVTDQSNASDVQAGAKPSAVAAPATSPPPIAQPASPSAPSGQPAQPAPGASGTH